MTNKTDGQPSPTRTSSKQDRDRDAATAIREYEAEKAAVLAKTARLRAMRLAREAGADQDRKSPGTEPAAPVPLKSAAGKTRAPAIKKKSAKR